MFCSVICDCRNNQCPFFYGSPEGPVLFFIYLFFWWSVLDLNGYLSCVYDLGTGGRKLCLDNLSFIRKFQEKKSMFFSFFIHVFFKEFVSVILHFGKLLFFFFTWPYPQFKKWHYQLRISFFFFRLFFFQHVKKMSWRKYCFALFEMKRISQDKCVLWGKTDFLKEKKQL